MSHRELFKAGDSTEELFSFMAQVALEMVFGVNSHSVLSGGRLPRLFRVVLLDRVPGGVDLWLCDISIETSPLPLQTKLGMRGAGGHSRRTQGTAMRGCDI